MKEKQKIKTSKKREQILSNAERLFFRFGAKRVSIEEICKSADVSRMTFYKYFSNKVELVKTIRDDWMEEGFKKFDEINSLELPFPDKINLMTEWKVELASRINAEFIREIISNDDVVEIFKQRYLGNIKKAQKSGELRSDIDPEFLWMVLEKLGDLVRDGSWKNIFSDFSLYQEQIRTLLFFGLLVRKEDIE